MHLVIYISDYTSNTPIEKTLKDIVAKAKVNNPVKGITGALFFHNGQFLQVIEGEKQRLDDMLEVIKNDHRHGNITVLVDEAVNNRSLSDWNMDSFDLSSNSYIDSERVQKLKEQFAHTCQLDTWLFLQVIKDALKEV